MFRSIVTLGIAVLIVNVLGVQTRLFAQEVILKNGKRIRWAVMVNTKDAVEVKTPDGIKMSISKTEIARITTTSEDADPVLTGATVTFKKKIKTVNLLASVNAKRDSFVGEWRVAGGALVSSPHSNGRLMLGELQAPSEYDLDVVVERASGEGFFGVYLVGGEGRKQFSFCFDVVGRISGIYLLDGKKADQLQGDLVKLGAVLAPRKQVQLKFMVRSKGFVVQVNGKDFFSWTGDWNRVGLHPQSTIPKAGVLGLRSGQASFRVRRATLAMPQ